MSDLTDHYSISPIGYSIPSQWPYPIIDIVKQLITAGAFGGLGGGGVTDHGALTGLADDDHPQYHNNVRGDARYALISHTHTIANVTGLQTALDNKVDDSQISAFSLMLLDDLDAQAWRDDLELGSAATQDTSTFALASHTHPESDITGLIGDLADKSDVGHTHVAADITDFNAAVDARIPAGTTYTADETTLTLSGSQFSIKNLGVVTAKLAATAVTYAKIQNTSATDIVLGRQSAGGGTLEEIAYTSVARDWSALSTLAAQKSYLGLSGTNTGDQTITLTGDVTGSGTGSFATTLAASGATAGTYINPRIIVDAKGRITFAVDGGATTTAPTDFKESVAVASTANLTLSGEQTIDGVLTAGSRILVKDQTTASQNGIYVTAAGAWTRATDADTSAEVTSGMLCYVESGTVNGGLIYTLITTGAITLGTTNLTFQATPPVPGYFVYKTVSGTTYSTVIADAWKRLQLTNAGTKTITLETQGTAAYPVNTEIEVHNTGAGTATIVGNGFTILGQTLTLAQYELGKLKKLANPNTWYWVKGGGVALSNTSQWTKNQSVAPYALTAGATINTDASQSNVFTVTLNQNATLANPTNLVHGMIMTWLVNNGTSPYTLVYGSNFAWGLGGTGTAPALSTTASKTHTISGVYDSASGKIYAALIDTSSGSSSSGSDGVGGKLYLFRNFF